MNEKKLHRFLKEEIHGRPLHKRGRKKRFSDDGEVVQHDDEQQELEHESNVRVATASFSMVLMAKSAVVHYWKNHQHQQGLLKHPVGNTLKKFLENLKRDHTAKEKSVDPTRGKRTAPPTYSSHILNINLT